MRTRRRVRDKEPEPGYILAKEKDIIWHPVYHLRGYAPEGGDNHVELEAAVVGVEVRYERGDVGRNTRCKGSRRYGRRAAPAREKWGYLVDILLEENTR